MSRLGTETAFEVLARAKALEKQGREMVHLEIGEPDFDTPQNIKDAAIKALKGGYTHYTPSAGILELREAIAEHISKSRGIDVDPDEVVVTPGAKPIMSFTILATVNPGDEVMYPNPGFPIYESMINFIGGVPVPIPLLEENDFKLNPADITGKITKKTKLIILNYPNNPTGGLLEKGDLKAIADAVARRDDLLVLADEIYSRILYEGKHESIAAFPGMKEKTVILDGFSKTYAMTGWRLGYGVMRKDLAKHLARLNTNFVSCTNAATQMAGVEALEGPQEAVGKMVAEFKRRRDVIVSGLNKIDGLSCKKPKGAFYVFPNFKKIGMSGHELRDFLLEKAGVASLPGVDFGKYGEGYMRFSYANSVENIKKALTKIEEALANR
jgi:aspartate/methionine/tyrosine aminotransferase